MESSVGYPNESFAQKASLKSQTPASGESKAAGITAVCIEFVAKPQEVYRAEAKIPAAIVRALKYVSGFAGCMVMISEHEARLVMVVTFWEREDHPQSCRQNARCVEALLAPYLDRRLRVQTMVAHLPVLPDIHQETIAVQMKPFAPRNKSHLEKMQ